VTVLFNVIPLVDEILRGSQLVASLDGSVVPAPFVLRLKFWKVVGLHTCCPIVYDVPETQATAPDARTAALAAAFASEADREAEDSELLTAD
jgi:hypothetical protein